MFNLRTTLKVMKRTTLDHSANHIASKMDDITAILRYICFPDYKVYSITVMSIITRPPSLLRPLVQVPRVHNIDL